MRALESLPGSFLDPRAMIDRTGQGEQQVGQTIDVSHQRRVGRRVECDHTPFCTATYCSSHVESGARWRTSREDESVEGRRLRVESIDRRLETGDFRIADRRFDNALRDA